CHQFRDAAGHRKRSAGLHGDEQSAFADEALKIGEALIAEAAADVVSGVQTGRHKVWRFGGVFPWTWIASHGQSAQYGAQASGTTATQDRKSTRLNSSHGSISYAVFCLKKKKKKT